MECAARVLSGRACTTSNRARAESGGNAGQYEAPRRGSKSRSLEVVFKSQSLRKTAAHVLGASVSGESFPVPPSNGASRPQQATTTFVAETLLPTRYGQFRVRAYRHLWPAAQQPIQEYTEPLCILTGSPEHMEEVPVRIHDACLTSEVLGSLKCDCADQLAMAMEYIQDHGPGAIIYLQQEGRGIGLANKIAAYAMQEKGYDTVDANRALGLPDDCREYSSVSNILSDLDIKSVRLLTNNPRKITSVEALGVRVTARIPCIVPAQQFNKGYLMAKQSRMSHWLDPQAPLDGQYCHWNHDGDILPLQGSSLPLPQEVKLDDGSFRIVHAEKEAGD